MIEEQLRAFPAFRTLPIVDEDDDRAISITRNHARECTTIDQVQKCLQDSQLQPVGALRAKPNGHIVVVAYFTTKPNVPSPNNLASAR